MLKNSGELDLISLSADINALKYKKFSYSPLVAAPHTPPYKIHKYFARRPWNVFEQLIDSFSEENEIVLDPFCGGGVSVYEGLRKNRKVIGCDINPLSIFIVENMVKKGCINKVFFDAINEIKEYLISITEPFMYFKKDGLQHKIDWCEVAFKARCHLCRKVITLSNDNKVRNGAYKCLNENCISNTEKKGFVEAKKCKRIGFQFLHLVSIDSSGGRVIKKIDSYDLNNRINHVNFLNQKLKLKNISLNTDPIPLDWDRQFEDGLAQKGINTFQDLFTDRNLIILTLLLHKIKDFKPVLNDDQYGLLRLIFSNLVKDTNIMSFTNPGWQSGRPATWSKHAYWIPSQFCEVTILPSFEKSIKRVLASVEFNDKSTYQLNRVKSFKDLKNGNLLLKNSPVSGLSLPKESVDVIVTDPPYGSNVQYLELSQFWYVWNHDLYEYNPDFSLEAISNRKKGFKGSKTMYEYEKNLYLVFKEAYKLLKPEKYMVLTFNNKDLGAWLSLLISIFKSGFTLSENGLYFQDGVKNYKQTAHTKYDGSPYGDFIYVFQKSKSPTKLRNFKTQDEFVQELDNAFKDFLRRDFKNSNDLIIAMFKKVIPLIESFSKIYLSGNTHQLYDHFKKDYLKKFING